MSEPKMIYCGQRLVNDRLLQKFIIDGDRSTVAYYKGIQWVVIGCGYKYEKKGKDCKISKRPDEISVRVSSKQIKEWKTEEHIAIQLNRRKIAAAKAKKQSDLVDLLRPHFPNTLSYVEARAFIEFLIDELYLKAKKRKAKS